MLETARAYLAVDVAFLAELVDGERILRSVAAAAPEDALVEGWAQPREATLCHRLVTGELSPVTQDAATDPRTRDLPVVAQLGIRGYAGLPIELSSGRIYGTLCCFTRDPDRTLGETELRSLELLAALVAERLEVEETERLAHLRLAERIRAALPTRRIVFQPLVSTLDGRHVGYEALARFAGAEPGRLFAAAGRAGLAGELERAVLMDALTRLHELPDDAYLSVNLSADVLIEPATLRILHDICLDRVVVELTENELTERREELMCVLGNLRGRGLRLALDDVGAAYAGLERTLRLAPELIKLDREIVRGIDRDRARRAMIAAALGFSREVGSTVVAEGVETAAELAVLRELGVMVVQGFHTGRPAPHPWLPQVAEAGRASAISGAR